MAGDVLINIVRFTNVAGGGGTATLAHGLNINDDGKVPDIVFVDNGNFTVTAVTDTDVTVQNNDAAPGNCDVWVEFKYSILRNFPDALTHLTPNPFIAAAGSSGGGGGSGNLVVWPVGTAWTTVYAEITALTGPVICLVQRDPGGARVMTNNGGSPTQLSNVLFVGIREEYNQIGAPSIAVDPGFVLDVSTDVANWVLFQSRGISWTFDGSGGPVVSGIVTNLSMVLYGSRVTMTGGAIPFQPAQLNLTLVGRSLTQGAGGVSLIDHSAGGGSIQLREASVLGVDSIDNAGAIPVSFDSSSYYDPGAFNAGSPNPIFLSLAQLVGYTDTAPLLGADNVQDAIDALKTQAFTYTCTGAEGSDFVITLPTAQPNDNYIPQVTLGGVTALFMVDCPDILATDRQTTQFRVITSAAVQAGDRLDVVIRTRT